MKTLEFIREIRPNCSVAIGRELTKVFEEVISDEITNVIEHFTKNPIKGEIVGMVFCESVENIDFDLDEKIKILLNKNFKAKEISIILSSLYNVNKNDVYKRVLEL